MKKQLLLLIFLPLSATAINPIVPPGTYLADPAARVWDDGKLYIYCSRDESPDYYCSWELSAMSTTDLINWTEHRGFFHSVGPNDDVPYSDNFLYAPDCFRIDDKYYLYYCMNDAAEPEGVAVGDTPLGPFKGAQVMRDVNQIDPAVFQDDDGEIYYYWGQFSAKMGKLRPDRKGIDPATYRDGIITEKEHHFHEGIQMFKRNGIYYLVYTDISRHGQATNIGYSTSDSPYGPFTYRGIIIDTYGCDPRAWNNHGCVVEFGGRWYVIYHRATHNCVSMRKACIEEITFNDDGTIDEVEMTTQGAEGPLDPFAKIDAERACFLSGRLYIEGLGEANEVLTAVENHNTAAYKYFDFTRTPKKVSIGVIPQAGGQITVYANNLCGPILATVDVPAGDGKTPVVVSAQVSGGISGVAPVYMRFTGAERSDLFQVDWFEFD